MADSSWIQGIGLCVAALGGGRAIIEYVRAGRWKASELASAQISAFADNDELAFACRALDWGVGPLITPERYRPIADNKFVLDHNIDMMDRALEPELRMKDGKVDLNSQELIYRYTFDRLFEHLSHMNDMIERKLFTVDDVRSIKSYLDLIVYYKFHGNKDRRTEIFVPFILKYEYNGVLDLQKKIKVSEKQSRMKRLLSRI